jgi:hypothetical protein
MRAAVDRDQFAELRLAVTQLEHPPHPPAFGLGEKSSAQAWHSPRKSTNMPIFKAIS